MSIILQKGSAFNAEYASTDYPVLSPDWTGSVSLYTTYPGAATFTKAMTRSGNKMLLALTVGEILALVDGLYSFVSTITNSVLGVTISSLDYATVSAVNGSVATKCKVFGTILKPDGTPVGQQTSSLVNTISGTVVTPGWLGVSVLAKVAVGDALASNVIGIDDVTTSTNGSGYFEVYVIQGLTVTVSCPSFGKTVSVNTTGQTAIDISTFF